MSDNRAVSLTGKRPPPVPSEASGPHRATPGEGGGLNYKKVVAGLRFEAGRALDDELRATYSCVASSLVEHLLDDESDARHLLEEAIAAHPGFGGFRGRALLELRQGADLGEALLRLQPYFTQHGKDPRMRRLAARIALVAACWADGDRAAALTPLHGTLLGTIYTAWRARISGDTRFPERYADAARACQPPVLKAALLADLASGLHGGGYPAPFAEQGLVGGLLLEAVMVDPDEPLYPILLARTGGASPSAEREVLHRQIQRGASPALRLRAAALAAASGDFDDALFHLKAVDPGRTSPLVDWALADIAGRAGETGSALAALGRLDHHARSDLEIALIALNRASLCARSGDLGGALDALIAAGEHAPGLDTVSVEVHRMLTRLGQYRALIAYEWGEEGPDSEPEIRRAEVLETRVRSPHEALRAYHRVLQHDPDDLFAQRAIERLSWRLEDYTGLADFLYLLAGAEPDLTRRTDSLSLLAQLERFELGRIERAVEVYERLVELVPDSLDARLGYLESLAEADLVAEAAEQARQLVVALPRSDQRRLALCDWLCLTRRADAVTLLRVARDEQELPVLLDHLERACIEEGLLAEAMPLIVLSGELGERETRLLAARDALQAADWSRAHRELATLGDDVGDAALLDLKHQLFVASRDLSGLRDLWTHQALQRSLAGNATAEVFTRWWDEDLDIDMARDLVARLPSSDDRRIVWAATAAAAIVPEDRAEAAKALLACDPDNLWLQVVAGSSLDAVDWRDDLTELARAWSDRAQGLEQAFLLHVLAWRYHDAERHEEAAAKWDLVEFSHPDFAPARAGRAMALMALGEVDAASSLTERVELERGHELDAPLDAQIRGLTGLRSSEGEISVLARLESARLALLNGWWNEAARWCAELVAEDHCATTASRMLLAALARGASVEPPGVVQRQLDMLSAFADLERDVRGAARALEALHAEVAEPEALAGLLLAARRIEDPELLLRVFENWAHRSFAGDLGAVLGVRSALIREFDLGDLPGALDHWRAVQRRSPGRGGAAVQLARVTLAAGPPDAERLRELRLALGERRESCAGLVLLARELSGHHRRDLLLSTLRVDPAHLVAEWMILENPGDGPVPSKVWAARGRRRRCAGLLARAAAASVAEGDPTSAESLCYEALKLGPVEEVAALGGPLSVLTRLLVPSDRTVELMAAIDDLLGRAASRPARRRVLDGLLRVAQGPARSKGVARRVFTQLVALAPADRALARRAVAAATQGGNWETAVQRLQEEQALAVATDPGVVPVISWEIGEIYRAHLDRPELASESYRKALIAAPQHEILGAAYERFLIETQRWGTLLEGYRAEIEHRHTPELVASAQVGLAGIFELHMDQPTEALVHYRTAAIADPENLSAVAGTARLLGWGDKTGAGAVITEALATELHDSAADALLLRAAEAAELVSDRRRDALERYERLRQSIESTARAVAVLGRDACLLGLGELERYHAENTLNLGPDGGAALREHADELLAAEATPPKARRGKTPLAVLAARLFRGAHETSAVASQEAVLVLARATGDAGTAAELVRLGVLAAADTGEWPARELLEYLCQVDPGDDLALLLFEARCAPGGRGERSAIESRLRAAFDRERRVEAFTGLLRHHAQRGEEDYMWGVLDRLRAELPNLALAPHFRAGLLGDSADPERNAERLEREAETAGPTPRRTELLLEAARLRRGELGQVARAIHDLRAALDTDPRSDEAFHSLREIFLAHGENQPLYDLLQRRAEVVDDPYERIATLERMAELALQRLDDPDRAVWCHQQIIQLDPSRTESYEATAQIMLASGRPAHAVEVLERLLRSGLDDAKIEPTRLRLASLYADDLQEPDRARAQYERVLAANPTSVAAIQGLIKLGEEHGDWDLVVAYLERLVERAPSHKRTGGVLLRLARAFERRGGPRDAANQERALLRAVRVAPDDERAVAALCRYAHRARRPQLIESIVRKIADGLIEDLASPPDPELIQLAFRLLDGMGWESRARRAAGVLAFFDCELERSRELRAAAPRGMRWHDLVAVPPERTACIFPPGSWPAFVEFARAIDEAVAKVFPSRAKELGAGRRNRVGRNQPHPARSLAETLGLAGVEVHVCLEPGTQPIVEPGSPGPVVLLGVAAEDHPDDDEHIWALTLALAPAATGCTAIARLPEGTFLDVVTKAIRVSHPGFLADDARVSPPNGDLAQTLAAHLRRGDQSGRQHWAAELATHGYDELVAQHQLLRVAFANLAATPCRDARAVLRSAELQRNGRLLARYLVGYLVSGPFDALQRVAGVSD
jgi:tetratricopeptide (TPR) repeat protein